MENWLRCCKWIEDNGGYIGQIEYKEGRQIVSSNRVVKGRTIMIIPKKCQIRTKKGMSRLIEKLVGEIKKGQESFYEPYLKLLPEFKLFETHPFLHMNAENLKLWTEQNREFTNYMLDLQTMFKQIQEDLTYINDKELLYPFLCIITRAWLTPLGEISLIPIMDMLDHANPHNWSQATERMGHEDPETQSYIMRCSQDIDKGQQIFDFYGYKSNLMLYAQYNFRDSWPIEVLDILIDSTNPKYSEYCRIMHYYDRVPPALDYNGWNTSLLAVFRLLILPISTLSTLKMKNPYYFTQSLDSDYELQLYSSLYDFIQTELSKITIIPDQSLAPVLIDKQTILKQTLSRLLQIIVP